MARTKVKKIGSPDSSELAELKERLERQEALIAELQARIAALEAGQNPYPGLGEVSGAYVCDAPTTAEDIIGCLDDCAVEEPTRRTRDGRRKKDRAGH